MPGLAGADRDAGGQVGLAGAGRAEEDDVLLGGDEVQGAQVGDQVAFEAAGVVEVELLQGLAGREPGGADAAFAAVGLAGGDLALQARGQELLVGPGLGPGPFGQPGTASRSVGAFNARVRNASSAAHVPAPAGCRAGLGGASCDLLVGDAERGVVHGQVPLLDLVRPGAGRGRCAARWASSSGRLAVGRVGDASGAWPSTAHGWRPRARRRCT